MWLKWRKILIILIILIIPLIFEYIGINFGGPMGVMYEYSESFNPKFLGLPLVVWGFWAIFIYVGYLTTNSILCFLFRKNYPALLINKFPLFVIFDGIIVVSFDIFIDPAAVKMGLWKWLFLKESYFGVPVGNFVGWFIIIAVTSVLIRTVDLKAGAGESEKIPLYSMLCAICFLLAAFVVNIDCALMGLLLAFPLAFLEIASIMKPQ